MLRLALFLLLLSATATSAQAPNIVVMPICQPGNEFYHDPNDAPDILRASLDNMPVKAGYYGSLMPNPIDDEPQDNF